MDLALTPRLRALYCLEVLLDSASERLSNAQTEYRYYFTRCDLGNAAMCLEEAKKAFLDCGKWSNHMRRLKARA